MSLNESYGDEESPTQLVPSSLVVFRHFKIWKGMILPMSGGGKAYRPGECDAEGWFQAECLVAGVIRYDDFGATYISRPPNHEAPVEDCRCGFYAHYRHIDDFYRSSTWGVRPLSNGELSGGDRLPTDTVMFAYAAVEIAGKTICGTKGVRAARMRVRALTLDWSKYTEASDDVTVTLCDCNKYGDQKGWQEQSSWHIHHDRGIPGRLQRDARIALRNAASKLPNCAVYQGKAQLQVAFPESDYEWMTK